MIEVVHMNPEPEEEPLDSKIYEEIVYCEHISVVPINPDNPFIERNQELRKSICKNGIKNV